MPTKKVKQAAKKKVASKTASTQEEKAGLRLIRERRNEHVNLLAKQLQEEANSEDADDHAAGNADSLKDAKQLLLQEDADVQGSGCCEVVRFLPLFSLPLTLHFGKLGK